MKPVHNPLIDARYWTAILLASVFGTNMGDLYAHESGLGIGWGLTVLAALAAVVFLVERFDSARRQVYYWAVIILIRTGATNIADYLAYKARVPDALLTGALVVLLALFGWGTHKRAGGAAPGNPALPDTNASYWMAMLTAGVFGTVVGDMCEHRIGEGVAALVLTALLLLVLLVGRGRAASMVALYWTTVAVARTAGTAIGDFFAESRELHVGLKLATTLSGLAFVAVLVFWRSRPGEATA